MGGKFKKAVLPACLALVLHTRGATAQPLAATDAATHIGKAVRLMQERLYSEAAAEFELALALTPNDDTARIQYATCLFAAERDQEARKQFEIERQRLGDRPGLNYYVGRLDLRADDYTAAIKKLAPLESDRALIDVSYYLGLAYIGAGQRERALECLERAARKTPRNPEVHYRLGRVYSLLGRTDDANQEYKLFRDWRESQRLTEQDGRECAEALRTRPVTEARIVCQRIADPNDIRRLIWLGELYSESGAFADAIDPLRRAVNLDPESFEAWQALGLSLFKLQRFDEALPALRKTASLNPRLISVLTLLASTLHTLGDDAAALPVLERAHNLNPEDAQVTSLLEQLRATLKGKR